MEIREAAQRFAELFNPNPDAYGYYSANLVKDDKKEGKLVSETSKMVRGKGRGCIFAPWSVENIEDHLLGKHRFGMFPLHLDSSVSFVALDIDEYVTLDHVALSKKIKAIFPKALLFRSKSGGAHVYFLFKEPVPAKKARAKMYDFSAILGLGSDREVFPKQNELDPAQDDKGNWINAPYFDMDNAVNYCINLDTGESYGFEEFLNHAETCKTTLEELDKVQADPGGELFKGGPPCLQWIWKEGVPNDRNSALYNAGLYAKKAFPNQWGNKVQELNQLMAEPLDVGEVNGIVKSLKNDKVNHYQCRVVPLCTFCNRAICRTRRHGVGAGTFPVITTITLYKTTPPVWWVYFDDGRKVTLESDGLLNQMKFRQSCLEQLFFITPIIANNEYLAMMSELITPGKLVEIDVPEDTKEKGILRQYIFDYLTSKGTSNDIEDLSKDKPVLVDGTYFFLVKDLNTWLYKRTMEHTKNNDVAVLLLEMGAKHITKRVGTTTRSVYFIKAESVNVQNESYAPPKESEMADY